MAHWIQTYGYWAVLLFVAIESAGIPLPGETVLITAAAYAGTSHRLNIFLVVIAAAAGAIIGDNVGYLLGHEGGYRLLRRFGPKLHLDERKLKVGQYLFMKHGGEVVFFGRFIAVLRAWAAFLAGTSRMHWRRFLLFNAAGGILWASVYGFGAYALGRSFEGVARPVRLVLLAIAVIAIAAGLLFMRRNAQRLEDEAARAIPGPFY